MTEKEQGKTTSKITGDINAEMMKTTRASQSLTDRMVQEIESWKARAEFSYRERDKLTKREVMLRGLLNKMNRAYVNLMENGRDRIVMLGGDCDPVDVMERDDPYLRELRESLAATDDLGGLILCEKEPVAEVKKHTGSLKDMAIIVWSGEQPAEGTQLYRAWEPKP